MSDSELSLREATVEDFQGILDITKGEYLWHGLDYIPFALKNWLQEGHSENSKRNNIVFEKAGEIVGFESFYFLDHGQTVIRFGFRVRKDLRGKGYGRRMIDLQLNYLREKFPQVVHTLSSIPDIDMADSAFTPEKFGERLLRSAVLFFVVDLKQYKMPSIELKDNLVKTTKDEYRMLLKNGGLKQLIPSNCLHMCWVSTTANTEDDIEFITRKQATVYVDDPVMPNSFSILSHAIPVPMGRRCAIDIYATNKEEFLSQLNQQLKEIFETEEIKPGYASDNLNIQIHIPPEQVSWVDESLQLFGIKENIMKFENKMKRDVIHMYVYKDKLHK